MSKFYSRNFKTLASFCGCAGRFVSGLVGKSRRHVLSCRGSIKLQTCYASCQKAGHISTDHGTDHHFCKIRFSAGCQSTYTSKRYTYGTKVCEPTQSVGGYDFRFKLKWKRPTTGKSLSNKCIHGDMPNRTRFLNNNFMIIIIYETELSKNHM